MPEVCENYGEFVAVPSWRYPARERSPASAVFSPVSLLESFADWGVATDDDELS